jgi:type IV secretory pathway VirB3-like protein
MSYLGWHSADEWSLPRRDPWSFRRTLRRWRTRMGRWLDQLAHGPVCHAVGDSPMTKRGEPLPINQAMNRSRAKLGLELPTWMVIVFFSITVFLVGFRILALISFPVLVAAAWLIVRKHPKMFQLWGHSLFQKPYYDPRKED